MVKTNTYRILGIDPGTRALGYAVVELGSGPELRLCCEGTCRPSPKESISRRLHHIYTELETVIATEQPDVVVIEEVFYGKNFKSALRIGESRGVVYVLAASADLKVYEYSPATVKQAVTGNGRASKGQVQAMVTRLLKLSEPPSSADSADAIAISFCHAQRARSGNLSTPARKKSSSRSRGVNRKALQALLDRINQGSD